MTWKVAIRGVAVAVVAISWAMVPLGGLVWLATMNTLAAVLVWRSS